MKLKLYLLLSLYCTAAFHRSHGMEKDEVYQNVTKKGNDTVFTTTVNHDAIPSSDVLSAKNSILPSQFLENIKDFYYYGRATDINIDIDIREILNYEALCLNGDDQACYQYYLMNKGIICQYKNIIDHIKQRADQKHSDAQYILGMMYYDGTEVKEDRVEAAKWFRKAADQEYAPAQTGIGLMYYEGTDVKKDYGEAFKWFRKAADQGHAAAQNNLGAMYFNGQGVKEDRVEAVKWYRKAADQGYAEAQYELGEMYLNGQGVEKNNKEAAIWYKKAADKGRVAAQYNLGWMYENGQGVEKSDKEAATWYRKAADQGDSDAQIKLGEMYLNGQGVEKNNKEAAIWYRKAAGKGDVDAQYYLGCMYINGIGVEENYAQGFYWLTKAMSKNSEAIKDSIYKIKNNLKTIFIQGMDSFFKKPLLVHHIQALCDGYKLISNMNLESTDVLSSFQKIITKISSPLSLPSDFMGHYEIFVKAIDDIKNIVGPFKKQDKKTVGKIEDKINELLKKAAQQKKAEDDKIERQRKQKEKEEKDALKKAKALEKALKKREEKAREKEKVLKEQEQARKCTPFLGPKPS